MVNILKEENAGAKPARRRAVVMVDFYGIAVDLTVERQPIVNIDGIRSWIDQLKYPLYFFDFETLAANPIPLFNISSSYELIPFQYSIHKAIDESFAQVIHREYLVDRGNDPRIELMERLIDDVADHGSIICWNMTFEKLVLTKLSERFPAYKSTIDNIISRIIDLMEPFKNEDYTDYRFHGSASLKSVKLLRILNLQQCLNVQCQNVQPLQKIIINRVICRLSRYFFGIPCKRLHNCSYCTEIFFCIYGLTD